MVLMELWVLMSRWAPLALMLIVGFSNAARCRSEGATPGVQSRRHTSVQNEGPTPASEGNSQRTRASRPRPRVSDHVWSRPQRARWPLERARPPGPQVCPAPVPLWEAERTLRRLSAGGALVLPLTVRTRQCGACFTLVSGVEHVVSPRSGEPRSG